MKLKCNQIWFDCTRFLVIAKEFESLYDRREHIFLSLLINSKGITSSIPKSDSPINEKFSYKIRMDNDIHIFPRLLIKTETRITATVTCKNLRKQDAQLQYYLTMR